MPSVRLRDFGENLKLQDSDERASSRISDLRYIFHMKFYIGSPLTLLRPIAWPTAMHLKVYIREGYFVSFTFTAMYRVDESRPESSKACRTLAILRARAMIALNASRSPVKSGTLRDISESTAFLLVPSSACAPSGAYKSQR